MGTRIVPEPACWVLWTVVLALLSTRLATADPPKTVALTPEPQQRLKERDRYGEESKKLRAQGKLVEAIAACEKMLAIERAVFGNVHEEVAGSLEQFADLHEQREDFAAASQARREVLAIRTKLHGEGDWRVTDAQMALDHLDRVAGFPADARRLLAEARGLVEECETLRNQGKFGAAIPIARRVLTIHEQVLGPANPETALTLDYVGYLLQAQGDYAGAQRYYERALAIRKKVLGPVHPETARMLNNLGSLLQAQGDYAGARSYLEQALAIRKKVLGLQHPHTASSLNNLGFLASVQGDYAGARPYYEQALAIQREALGPEHPNTAIGLTNLGGLLYAQGNYAAARPYYEQALAIRKKVLGPVHPDTANSLNNLGYLLQAQGDYAGARSYLEQALAIRKQVLGPEHPDTATSLNNVGTLLCAQGEYAAARPYFEEALAIRAKKRGPEHADTAQSLNNLAYLLKMQGDYAKARLYYEQALAIRMKVLGPEHRETSNSLNNLGGLLYAQGDYAKARPYYERALAIRMKVLGPEHPDTARILNNFGKLLYAQADYAGARPYFEQALTTARKHLELTSWAQAEREQLLMIGLLRTELDAYLSLALRMRLPAESVHEAVLSWKGAVLARQRRVRMARQDPQLGDLWGKLEDTSRRLATLYFALPNPKQVDSRHRQIEELTREKEQWERELRHQSAAFQKQRKLEQLTHRQLQGELSTGTALIDLLEYSDHIPPPGGKGSLVAEQHLVAFVVRPGRPIVHLDLGPTEPIVAAVERWRAGLTASQTALAESQADPAAELRRLVWQPLERHLRGVQVVLVSPDGPLARFPFAALPGSRPGSYLIEELSIAVLPVPQLLPQLLAERQQNNAVGGEPTSLLLVGDVDFGATPGPPARDPFHGQLAMRGGAGHDFPRLPGTAGEIASIEATFERAHPHAAVYGLRGAEATEQAFRREAPGKRYLHLATHGFFAPPELKSALESSSKEVGDSDRTIGLNPGLLSGLALAGCNRGPQTAQDNLEQGDDGILTALEVAELDLSRADLVVLSACETGLGKVAGGEGLLGLQRAFQIAGARTVVASLWKVDDEATRELMSSFYDNLWKGQLPPLEALRQAQLHILDHPSPARQVRGLGAIEQAPPVEPQRRADPRLWAAWVLSGDPGNLTHTLAAQRPNATATAPAIGGTIAALILMLTGLSALQLRRRTRSRVS